MSLVFRACSSVG